MVRLGVPVVTVITGISSAYCILSLGPMSEAAMRQCPYEARQVRRLNYSEKGRASNILSASDVLKLQEDGIVVIDNVLLDDELIIARNDVASLQLNNKFNRTEQDDADVRTDHVCWVNESFSNKDQTVSDGLLYVLRLIRSIPAEILDQTTLSTTKRDSCIHKDENIMGVPFSNQLSIYQSSGARYVPHLDAGNEVGLLKILQYYTRAGIQEREYTVIVYLNERNWSDGRQDNDSMNDGCLRCYLNPLPNDETGISATKVLDVVPNGGRMVIFDSKLILHEVLATNRERIALTCWIGGSHSSFKFLRPYCV